MAAAQSRDQDFEKWYAGRFGVGPLWLNESGYAGVSAERYAGWCGALLASGRTECVVKGEGRAEPWLLTDKSGRVIGHLPGCPRLSAADDPPCTCAVDAWFQIMLKKHGIEQPLYTHPAPPDDAVLLPQAQAPAEVVATVDLWDGPEARLGIIRWKNDAALPKGTKLCVAPQREEPGS